MGDRSEEKVMNEKRDSIDYKPNGDCPGLESGVFVIVQLSTVLLISFSTLPSLI